MRKSKQQVEAELQEALNEHLPEKEQVEESILVTSEPEQEWDIPEVSKLALRPKVGKELPIAAGLVGCTKALFQEYRHQTTVTMNAPYCLKANDHEYRGVIYKSMYLIYMSCDSEYEAAIKLLGNYRHWTKLKRCTWFLPYVEEWNAELVLRESALAKSKLVKLTEAGNVTAARTLLNDKKIAGVGKPRSKGVRKDDIAPGDIDEMLDRTDMSKSN
ncbi:MAG: hypothetical protein V3T88_03815 [Nitrosomonadaceae bacterium]